MLLLLLLLSLYFTTHPICMQQSTSWMCERDGCCPVSVCTQRVRQPTWSCDLGSSGLDGGTAEADGREPTARYFVADTRERSPSARERSTQTAHFMVRPSPRWPTVKGRDQKRWTAHWGSLQRNSTVGARKTLLLASVWPGGDAQRQQEAVRWHLREEQTPGFSEAPVPSTSQTANFPEPFHFETTGPNKTSEGRLLELTFLKTFLSHSLVFNVLFLLVLLWSTDSPVIEIQSHH